MVHVPQSEAEELPESSKPVSVRAEGVWNGDDHELVRRPQHRHKLTFEALVRTHRGPVLAVAGGVLKNREGVEHIAQQAFLQVHFSLKQFDQRRA
jgi:hypothetical protein